MIYIRLGFPCPWPEIFYIWSGYGTQHAGVSSTKLRCAMDADETQPMEVEESSSLFSLEMPVDGDGADDEDDIPATQPDLDEPQEHKVRSWQNLQSK